MYQFNIINMKSIVLTKCVDPKITGEERNK